MFRPHARLLAEEGYRVFLMDLPGHGALVDEKFSITKFCGRVHELVTKHVKKPCLFAGFEECGYLGMEVLARHPHLFVGAALSGCGENRGADAPLLSRSKNLWMARYAEVSNWKNMFFMSQQVSNMEQAAFIIETCLLAGVFYDQSGQLGQALGAVEPLKLLPAFPYPIFFSNGLDATRESEELWLSMCSDKGESTLKNYEGPNSFTHVLGIAEQFIADLATFAGKCEWGRTEPRVINLAYAGAAPNPTPFAAEEQKAPIAKEEEVKESNH